MNSEKLPKWWQIALSGHAGCETHTTLAIKKQLKMPGQKGNKDIIKFKLIALSNN